MPRVCLGYDYLPDGCPTDHHDSHTFAVKVIYKGTYPHWKKGGEPVAWYAVEHFGASLSRAGKWAGYIQKFQYPQYRFTLEEACEWAEKTVNDITVMGKTFAQHFPEGV